MFKSKLIYPLLFVLLLLGNTGSAFAQENLPATASAATPNISDSYTLFWPVVAGKTMDNRLFFLKEWKESIKGVFIFGRAESVDYEIQLSTKRILETEKLLNEKKNIYALKSLERAKEYLISAHQGLQSSEKNKLNHDAINNINNQLENLDMFLVSLNTNTNEDVKSKINEIQQVIKDIKTLLS